VHPFSADGGTNSGSTWFCFSRKRGKRLSAVCGYGKRRNEKIKK
jgi:hypothetical protein